MERTKLFMLFIPAVAALLPALLFAQILNGGFEQWTGNTPDNWLTDNAPTFYTPVTQSSTNHSGSYSVKGQVVDYQGILIAPLLTAGAAGNGFTVSQKYLSLTGYYEFAPLGGDELVITVLMYNSTTLIGGGSLDIQSAAASFTPFALGIEYYQDLTPDNVMITVTVGNSGDIHKDTEFKLDDLELSMTPTSVETAHNISPASPVLNQNYPNPFNPFTVIGFSLPQTSVVSLTIFDLSGKVVDKLIDHLNMAAGYHSLPWKPASTMPSGAYFYKLEAGAFSQSKRMMFIK